MLSSTIYLLRLFRLLHAHIVLYTPLLPATVHTMWLINCRTGDYNLEFKHDHHRLDYAVLSHTWGDEEVTFQDMQDINTAKKMKGFDKIRRACEIALSHGYDFAWVDTCCIDKSSSAELTEAINSMFRWYRASQECIAFLEDLEPGQGELTESQLRPCRWFSRGWTLQELIAPESVLFYDKEWKLRGNKRKLVGVLHQVTGIDVFVLRDPSFLRDVSVARRMSWAALRETTRQEDQAYCLMGIFDVSMPLLYGECGKAFIRLQETIAQQSNDLSLFAWQYQYRTMDAVDSIFASSPAFFSTCTTVELVEDPVIPRPFVIMGNVGLQLTTSLAYLDAGPDDEPQLSKLAGTPLWHLGCKKGSAYSQPMEHRVLVLPLEPTSIGYARSHRLDVTEVDQCSLRFQDPAQICVAKVGGFQDGRLRQVSELGVRFSGLKKLHPTKVLCYPQHLFNPQQVAFITGNSLAFIGLMKIQFEETDAAFWLVCGYIWAYIVPDGGEGSIAALSSLSDSELRNPFNLSSVGIRLRAMHLYQPESFPASCVVRLDTGEEVSLVASWDIMTSSVALSER